MRTEVCIGFSFTNKSFTFEISFESFTTTTSYRITRQCLPKIPVLTVGSIQLYSSRLIIPQF